MSKAKIDIIKLERMLRSGKSVKEIAEYFSCTPGAVSMAKKGLNVAVVKSVALENAQRVVDKNLNTIDQLQRINQEANRLLDEAEKDPDLKIKVMGEIRQQLKLQMEIFQYLYDFKAVAAFQEEVLNAIGEVDDATRKKIIYALNEKRALRSALRID